MKKYLIPVAALVALAFGTVAAQADDNRSYRDGKPGMGCHKKGDHFQRMAKRLNLSDEQQARARAIFDKSKKERRHLREERRELHRELAELDPEARDYDRKVRAIARKKADLTEKSVRARAETRKEFHMLLTKEQRAEVREMRSKFRERMQRKSDKRDGWRDRGERNDRPERGRSM